MTTRRRDFFILRNACVTRATLSESGSWSIVSSTVDVIWIGCHESPYRYQNLINLHLQERVEKREKPSLEWVS